MEERHKDLPETSAPHTGSTSGILSDKEIARAVRKKSYPTWKDLLAIVGIFLASNLLMSFIVLSFFGGQLTGPAMFISYVATFAVTIAFALTLARQRTGTSRNRLGFTFKGFNPAVILWGLILMLAMNVVIEPVINLFPAEWYKLVQDQIVTGGWATVTAVVMAPICEEVLFRGIIQNSLVRKHGPWSGILIASAIFGLIHGVPQQVVAGFCLGIIIGFVYYRTGSLLAAMVLHAINNALATFMSLFENEESSAEQTLREMLANDTLYWIGYAFCALLLIVSLIQVQASIRKGREREKLRAAENSQP